MDLKYIMDHIIDLRHSKWDEKLSDPEKGKYVFTEKRYLSNRDKSIVREHRIETVRYSQENGLREYLEARDARGMSPLLAADKLYHPEGANVNAQGAYQFMDAVFMTMPYLAFLEERKQNVDQGMTGGQAVIDKFKAEGRSAGVEIVDA
jgi:hypothetical protein